MFTRKVNKDDKIILSGQVPYQVRVLKKCGKKENVLAKLLMYGSGVLNSDCKFIDMVFKEEEEEFYVFQCREPMTKKEVRHGSIYHSYTNTIFIKKEEDIETRWVILQTDIRHNDFSYYQRKYDKKWEELQKKYDMTNTTK